VTDRKRRAHFKAFSVFRTNKEKEVFYAGSIGRRTVYEVWKNL